MLTTTFLTVGIIHQTVKELLKHQYIGSARKSQVLSGESGALGSFFGVVVILVVLLSVWCSREVVLGMAMDIRWEFSKRGFKSGKSQTPCGCSSLFLLKWSCTFFVLNVIQILCSCFFLELGFKRGFWFVII